MRCTACNNPLVQNARFCSQCGTKVPKPFDFSAERDTISLTEEDRRELARQFNEWRKETTLTAIGRVLTHNAAWENYFEGYLAGFAEGAARAYGWPGSLRRKER